MRGESEDFSNVDFMNSPEKNTLNQYGGLGNDELVKSLGRS